MVAKVVGRQSTRAGIAGLEFALIAPVLMVLLLGTVDISRALITTRWIELAAASIAEIGTTGAVQTQALDILTDVQAWQATTAAFVLFPAWGQRSASPSFAITLSAITFTATPSGCTQNCTYTAKVVWSVANNLGITRLRPCGPVTRAPDGDSPSYATLPASAFGPTSLLVADVSYTFQPSFFGFLIGDISMMQSAYISPRIDNGIQLLNAGGAGPSLHCAAAS